MSRVDASPLATYNSLMDPHLAGYFCNQKRRKHLVRSGLITRQGDVISENTYRLNMARKEHKKHVKDLLAQAIVHKTLDMERTRQVKIKQKLEEISKIELVRRMKAECNRTGDEELLPYLTPRSGVDGSHQSRDRSRAKSARSMRENETGIYVDDEGCPVCSREGSSRSSSQQRPKTTKSRQKQYNKYPKDDIDSRHLYALDQYTLYEYNLSRKTDEQSRTSAYLTPVISKKEPKPIGTQPAPPRQSAPPRQPVPPRQPKSESGSARRPKTAPSSHGDKKSHQLYPSVPPMTHPEELKSGVEVTLKYFGERLKLAYEPIGDPRENILVEQQPSGGNTLNVFKKPIMRGDTFKFISTRHRGFPFSLTLYVNGVQNARLSTCCEFKHKPGAKIGGKAGHFGLVSVSGGIGPCFKCAADQRTRDEKNKGQREKEPEPEKEPEVKEEIKQEESVKFPVEDEEEVAAAANEDDYDDDDFEDDADDEKSTSRDKNGDRDGRGGAGGAASGGGGSGRSSGRRGSDSGSDRQSPTSGRSRDGYQPRDDSRDSPVSNSRPQSQMARSGTESDREDQYTLEVEDDEDKTMSPRSDKEPSSPAKERVLSPKRSESDVQSVTDKSQESPRKEQVDESGVKSDQDETEPGELSRPVSEAASGDTYRGGITSETEDELETFPPDGNVQTLVDDNRDFFDITDLILSPKQMADLAEIIKRRDNLVSVVLRNCGMDDTGCQHICDAIRQSPSLIKMVNLNMNKALTSASAQHIGNMVRDKPSIQVLLLHGDDLGDAGIQTLASTLEDIQRTDQRSSPHLDVARDVVQDVLNDLTAEDSDPGTQHQLKILDIGDTKMTESGAESVAKIIALDSTIQVLSLTGCIGFASPSWKIIFESLKSNTKLTKLCLDYCNLRDSVVEHLSECLYSHPTIECLDFEGNGLTDRAANALVRLTQSNSNVKKLKLLPGNRMSDDALDDIQDALRRSKQM